MFKYSFFSLTVALVFFAISCKNNATPNTTAAATLSQKPAEAPTTVSLTAEQIKTIGISIGGLEQRELSSVVRANGTVSVLNQNKALITFPYSGTVKAIHIHPGAAVKAGDLIATLSNPDFVTLQEEYLTVLSQLNAGNADAVASVANPQYAGLQEQFQSLQPAIEMAELELKRQNQLSPGNIGSLKNLQQAETNLAALKSKSQTLQTQMGILSKNAAVVLRTKRAALESKLKLMGINPATLTPENMQTALAVRSPISGKVGEISAKIGAYLGGNDAIAEIIDLSNLHLDLNIYEPDLAKFHTGQIIQFTLTNAPGQTYSAKVHTIGSMINPTTKTVEVHARIEGNQAGLLDGMNATATIRTGKTTVTAVPDAALVREDGRDYIFVQKSEPGKDLIFEKVPVRIGASEQGFTEITPLASIPEKAQIATSQAFFILGKMTNTGEE